MRSQSKYMFAQQTRIYYNISEEPQQMFELFRHNNQTNAREETPNGIRGVNDC